MVTSENDRELPSSGVVGHDAGDSLGNAGHESRVLHLPDWWVVLLRDLLELVVSVELYLPSQILKLLFEASVYQVDGTVVDSELSLGVAYEGWYRSSDATVETYLAASREYRKMRLALCG